MVKMLRFNKFEDIGERNWADALNLSKESYIFQTYDYLRIWWKYFGEGQNNKEALILAVEKDGCIVAIAPLMIFRTRFFKTLLIKFMGGDICDYMDFIADDNNYDQYVIMFMDFLSKFRFLAADLKYIPQDSKIIDNLSRLTQHDKIIAKIYTVDFCPYINLTGGFPKIYHSLKSKLRAEISRNERNLQESGCLEFKTCSQEDVPDDVLSDYFDLHIKKWKLYSKKYSQFQYGGWRGFVKELCVLLLNKGRIDLSYLKFDKGMIACHFGFIYEKRLYYYMPTFDPDFAAYSPAKILIMKMFERSCSAGLKEFDFLRGDEPYKMLWTKSFRKVYNLAYFNRKLLLRYSGLAYMGIRNGFNVSLKPIFKKIAPLMSAWYTTRGDIKSGNERI